MFCLKCGNKLNEGAVFCPKCGAKVDVKDVTPSNEQTSENKAKSFDVENKEYPKGNTSEISTGKPNNPKGSKTGIIIAVAAVVVTCAIGAYYFISQNSYTSSTDNGSYENSQIESNTVQADFESEKTLLGLIESAEEIMNKSNEDFNAVQRNENESLYWQEKARIFEEAASKLEELSKQASQLQGIDPKLQAASEHYFEMLISSRKIMGEVDVFFSDYFGINLEYPDNSDYSYVKDFYNSLYGWYTENKDKVDAISVPQCVEAEWINYKKIFETVDDIVNKEYLAVEYNDYLRHHTAQNLYERFKIAEENSFNSLLKAEKGEWEFSKNQYSIAIKLGDEIEAYCEKDESLRSNYQFEYDRDTKITTNGFDAVDTIYPALFNTYNAFVVFNTGCICGNRDIVVEAEIPGFTQVYKQSYHLDSSYKAIYIKPPALSGDIDLSTQKDAQINVSVYEKDGSTLITSQSFPVTIMSINDVEWYNDEFGVSTQDNILCYLTPDADEIDLLKRNAINEIYNISGGTIDSMAGYQQTGYGNYVGTYLQAAGIMRALFDMGVRYDVSSFSISDGHQRVKLPKEVIDKKSGLCIETALTVASAIQSAGMHAVLVMPPGHAQVAVEICNDGGEGTGEYFLIETTSLSSDLNNDEIYRNYANGLIDHDPDELKTHYPIAYLSASEWKEYLAVDGTYEIDCDDSRLLGFTEFAN